MSPAPSGNVTNGPERTGSSRPGGAVQDAVAFGQARQATLWSGTQHNHFGGGTVPAEAALSIAEPVGERDPRLPLRGRDALLAELTGPGAGGVRVIHGLGGCGKTRLALEVAWLARQRCIEVWWVSAADQGRLIAGMRAVGRWVGVTDRELAHGEAADLVWRRLSDRSEPWLLVIDNADDSAVLAGPGGAVGNGTGWLRPVRRQAGMVVVTSRDGRASSWGSWCRMHSVGMLRASEATEVLTDNARHQAVLGNDTDAAALAGRLGCLPLALKIAGSYLAEAAPIPAAFAGEDLLRTYRQYQEAVEAGELDIAFPAPREGALTEGQARGLIGRTWELSLDLLEGRRLPEARPILRLLACLADAPVPYQALLHPGTLAQSHLFRGITGPRIWQVLQALAGFGLVDLADTSDTATVAVARIHPLVRDTSRPRPDTSASDLSGYMELAARLLHRVVAATETGQPEEPGNWPFWQLITPHALEVFTIVTTSTAYQDSAVGEAAYAAGTAARYQSEQGLHVQALASQRQVLAAQLRVLGPDHPDIFATRHAIAYEMAQLGDQAGALAEFRDILAARQRRLGPDHPDTLSTRHAIAYEMANLGDPAGALAEHRNVLAAELRVLGPEHRQVLITRHQIAWEMSDLGDHAGALAECRDLLATWERLLGPAPDHPGKLATRFQIAYEMAQLGDHTAALAEFRDVLAARLRVLGPDQPDTLATRYRIAIEIGQLGDHTSALAEHRDVLAAWLRVVGPDHPDTLATRYQIAAELAQFGDHAGALAEFRDVLAARLRVLGSHHPDTLAAANLVQQLEASQS